MTASKFSPEERKAIVDYYLEHGPKKTVADYAAKGIALKAGTIGGWARKLKVSHLDVSADRVLHTRKATEAAALDHRAKRQQIHADLYEQVQEILSDLKNPTSHKILRMDKGTQVPDEITWIPVDDKRTMIQTIGSALSVIDKYDALTAPIDPSEGGRDVITDIKVSFKTYGEKLLNGEGIVTVVEADDEHEIIEDDEEQDGSDGFESDS